LIGGGVEAEVIQIVSSYALEGVAKKIVEVFLELFFYCSLLIKDIVKIVCVGLSNRL